jgi:hypothetical protein
MAANDTATVTMTETVSHEITLTHARLAELLDVAVTDVPALLAEVDRWSATGPVEDNTDLLDEIDCDTYRAGSEDRTWAVRALTGTGPVPPAPPITDPAEITAGLLVAAADHSERRARALIEQGVDQTTAVEQAADEAILFTRRVAQMARQGRTIVELVAAYDGNTCRLLRDLGEDVGASLAYVDRPTVEAHLERTLSDAEWAATSDQFTALDFDEHVGDHGTFRTDWIESVLEKAGVPGYEYTADSEDADSEDADQPSSQSATGGAAA